MSDRDARVDPMLLAARRVEQRDRPSSPARVAAVLALVHERVARRAVEGRADVATDFAHARLPDPTRREADTSRRLER